MNLKLKRIKELMGYTLQVLKEEGPGPVLRRAAGFIKRRFFGKKARYLPKKQVLEAQRKECAKGAPGPVISICVPLYNTPEPFLRQLLDSVLNQTSPGWELCLADASDEAHRPAVKKLVDAAAEKAGSRIRYKAIENKGISHNTNHAAALATGGYLALADHDDVLAPHAIYTVQKAIAETGAAFLYSDEALFTKKIEKPTVGHFKPDYAPDYLLCCNYICHLAVFRRSEFLAVGGERPE